MSLCNTTLTAEELVESPARPWAQSISARKVLLLLTLATVAVGLRVWNVGAVYEASDQVAMAHMVRHNYGIEWIFAHSYGPVLPVIQRGFAQICMWCHLPLNEASARLPGIIVGCLQVVLTYFLMRRLRCSTLACWCGTVFAVVMPALVIDAHYSWSYLGTWLFFGTLSLWATLAWLDTRRFGYLFIAGSALMLHCLSNAYSFALPITIAGAYLLAMVTDPQRKVAVDRRPSFRRRYGVGITLGFIVPCLLALGAIVFCYIWTGGGQVGHLMAKNATGTLTVKLQQFFQFPALWFKQLGLFGGSLAAVGIVAGTLALLRLERIGLPAVWAWNGLLPVLILADWSRIGCPEAYFINVMYVGGLLGVWFMVLAYEKRWLPRIVAAGLGGLALGRMLLFSIYAIQPGTLLGLWFGSVGAWGYVQPDSGIKAAGGYVRDHVPANALVLCLHANDGMEANLAEYYCGRKVLAHYDLLPETLLPLLDLMRDRMDVVIADTQQAQWMVGDPDFETVGYLRNGIMPVRYIFARRSLHLPVVSADVDILNDTYDRRHAVYRVPQPLPAAEQYLSALTVYQSAVSEMKATRRQRQIEAKNLKSADISF